MMHHYQANVYATLRTHVEREAQLQGDGRIQLGDQHLKDVSATGQQPALRNADGPQSGGQGADGNERMEVGGGQNEYALMGFFGRLNYDYKGKYLVEVSRYDGTSRFKRGHRWGFFLVLARMAHLGGAFLRGYLDNFSNQDPVFVRPAGQPERRPHDYIRKISIGNQSYLFGGDKPTTATISASPWPRNFSWETRSTTIWAWMSFLNNRLAFSADFYIRDTKDMLTAGVALPRLRRRSPKMNSADLRTKGYELSLSWRDEFQPAPAVHLQRDGHLQRLRDRHHQIRQP